MTKIYLGEVFQDNKGDWRWRLVAKNKNIVASSGEGYKNKSECLERLHDVTTCGGPNMVVEELDKSGQFVKTL